MKSSAYLQAWAQRRPSQIRFTGLRGRAWGDITAGLADERTYKADVYVLSVLTTKHHDSCNPLDVNAWDFYVLPRAAVADLNVESLSLATVARLTDSVSYAGLADAVRAASATTEPSQ